MITLGDLMKQPNSCAIAGVTGTATEGLLS